jgi:hypothetical protein
MRSANAHGIEGLDVHDVKAAASVHQHLGKVLRVDDGVGRPRVGTGPGVGCSLGRRTSRR